MTSSNWRLICCGKGSPDWNMALDEALLREVSQPVLRVYEWDRPALSIGYFQSHLIVPSDREFIRRYTGGGLVDHAADFTYTVVLPRGNSVLELSTSESYRQIHEAVVKTLVHIGLDAVLAPCCDPEEKDSCFQRAVKYDVVLGAVKVAGAAQRRTREGMLQQGSVLLEEESLRVRFRENFPRVFQEIFNVILESSEFTEKEILRAQALVLSRYGTEEWNKPKEGN